MRLRSFLIICALAGLAACERQSETPEPESAPVERTEALLSDELPGLAAPATGVAFWEHPSLPFNSLLIVSNEQGVVSYNMENGAEVSRLDGFHAVGAAVSYFGFGAQAAGFVAFFDEADSRFRFYGIDNASRAFLPLAPGPEIRGVVRDFCMDRPLSGNTPILFAVQNSKVQFFALAAESNGVTIAEQGELDTPGNMIACTVDNSGSLILAADDGAIYRLNAANAFEAPIATAKAQTVSDLSAIWSTVSDNGVTSLHEQFLVLDGDDGSLHVVNADDGRSLGIVDFVGTLEMPSAGPAKIMGVSSANLGAVYRDGVIAMGATGDEGPVVRVAPQSSLSNGLSLPVGEPVSPRGALPKGDDGLIISIPEIGNQHERPSE